VDVLSENQEKSLGAGEKKNKNGENGLVIGLFTISAASKKKIQIFFFLKKNSFWVGSTLNQWIYCR
jgi:hypothetical protein